METHGQGGVLIKLYAQKEVGGCPWTNGPFFADLCRLEPTMAVFLDYCSGDAMDRVCQSSQGPHHYPRMVAPSVRSPVPTPNTPEMHPGRLRGLGMREPTNCSVHHTKTPAPGYCREENSTDEYVVFTKNTAVQVLGNGNHSKTRILRGTSPFQN